MSRDWRRNTAGLDTQAVHYSSADATSTTGLIRRTQTYYDNAPKTALVGTGLATRVDTATAKKTDGSLQYAKTTSVYDTYGRVASVTAYPTGGAGDPGRTTSTTYTPAGPGSVTSMATKTGNHPAVVTTFSPGREVATSVTDSAGYTTSATIDQVGRYTAVWNPGMPTTGPASVKYSYVLSQLSAAWSHPSAWRSVSPRHGSRRGRYRYLGCRTWVRRRDDRRGSSYLSQLRWLDVWFRRLGRHASEGALMIRLETVDTGLVALVESATDDRRRRAALAAAEFAIARSGLSDDRIKALLDVVRSGKVGDTVERRRVEAVIESLDERQWDLQDQLDAGDASTTDYLRAFAEARTATAVAFAADPDARVAALESLYEAHAAINDLDGLRDAVIPTLTQATS